VGRPLSSLTQPWSATFTSKTATCACPGQCLNPKIETPGKSSINLCPTCAPPKVELWFGGECAIEAGTRPRRRWAEPGSKPETPYSSSHVRRSVIGVERPSDGSLSSLIVTYFQAFAEEQPPKEGICQFLILDTASWHKSKFNWHHFEPEFLPPYSPDLNPIETFWLRVKTDFFADFLCWAGNDLERLMIRALSHIVVIGHPKPAT
jgi:hypothetical protein